MRLFPKRIRPKRFYNYRRKKLNIKGISAVIPKTIISDIKIGEISSEQFPSKISDRLKEIDIVQVQIARGINSMQEGEDKEKKKSEYVEKLFEMLQVAKDSSKNNSDTDDDKARLNSEVLIKNSNIYNSFKTANHVIANMKAEDFNHNNLIIWPVALKDKLTVIHKAQIEVIRVLQTKGWKLKIIIADCGNNIKNNQIQNFTKDIISHSARRGVSHGKIELLSDYFKTTYKDRGDILTKFIEISSSLETSKLSSFNKKDDTYNEETQKEIDERPILRFIQPVLTWSVVLHIAENYSKDNNKKKAIVIAGKDEEKQWRHVFDKVFRNIGAIFIPILKTQDNGKEFTASQEKLRNFYSENEVIAQLDNGNISKWLFDSFLLLPDYPNKHQFRSMNFCNKGCRGDEDCIKCLFPEEGNTKLPDFVNREKFVNNFWSIINPA